MSGAHMQTHVHVFPQTELWFRSYPDEQRVTFHIGPNGHDAVVYLGLVAVERLSAVLAEARQSLQAPALKAAA